MLAVSQLGSMGGVFALLVFWHFFADWTFQTHEEAIAKATDWLVRCMHSLIYTVLFAPVFAFASNLSVAGVLFAFVILFTSHFFIDTYWPVMMWAKYLRGAPQFKDVVPPVKFTKEQMDQMLAGTLKMEVNPSRKGWSDKEIDRITYPSDKEAFKAFFMTPVGAILCITMDQLFHIAFLLPIAYLMVVTGA